MIGKCSKTIDYFKMFLLTNIIFVNSRLHEEIIQHTAKRHYFVFSFLLAQRNQGNAIFDRIKPFVFKL
jgi:hypothetical protein